MTSQPTARLTGAMKPVGVLVEDVPESVRSAVDADAQSRDANRNDVVCGILAERFGVHFVPSGYPWVEGDGATQWNLRMSAELRRAIKAYSDERGWSQRSAIIITLQIHYELAVDSPRRRPSHPPLDATIVREARVRHEAGESLRSLARRYGVKRETLTKAIRAT